MYEYYDPRQLIKDITMPDHTDHAWRCVAIVKGGGVSVLYETHSYKSSGTLQISFEVMSFFFILPISLILFSLKVI